jgi:hypothetical protein
MSSTARTECDPAWRACVTVQDPHQIHKILFYPESLTQVAATPMSADNRSDNAADTLAEPRDISLVLANRRVSRLNVDLMHSRAQRLRLRRLKAGIGGMR